MDTMNMHSMLGKEFIRQVQKLDSKACIYTIHGYSTGDDTVTVQWQDTKGKDTFFDFTYTEFLDRFIKGEWLLLMTKQQFVWLDNLLKGSAVINVFDRKTLTTILNRLTYPYYDYRERDLLNSLRNKYSKK